MELALIGTYGSWRRRAVMGICTGGVATGGLWELLWRGGYWRALGAALAGWLLAGSGSCSGGVATGGLWVADAIGQSRLTIARVECKRLGCSSGVQEA